MIGKYGITASLAILVLYAGEIYPTTLRNEGLGLASTAGRIGGMVAPFAVYLVNLPRSIYVKNNLKFMDQRSFWNFLFWIWFSRYAQEKNFLCL